MKPLKATCIAVVCAVLHNLRLAWGEPPMDPVDNDDQPDQPEWPERQMDGRSVLDLIARTYFS
jgi:hypothetical protein